MKDFKMPTGKDLEKVLVELNKARKALGAPELSKDQFDKMALVRKAVMVSFWAKLFSSQEKLVWCL